MMLNELQQHLQDTKRYEGIIDGRFGSMTDAAIRLALSDGPDTPVALADFAVSAARMGVQPAAIRAFWKVEAAGAGFEDGMPKVLPEPHRFSKNTGHRFDLSNPDISYPAWGSRPYPKGMGARYGVIMRWVRLLTAAGQPIDAAFASASYGAPQIMGENAAMCGFPDPFTFAEAMARDEATQLVAFERFVNSAGILPFLQKVNRTKESWTPVARRYNGSAQAANHYDEKMLAAFIGFGGV